MATPTSASSMASSLVSSLIPSATSNPLQPNPDFNPFTQPVTLLMPDGLTPFNTTLDQFNWYMHQVTRISIQQGVELGLTVVTLLVFACLTSPAKRRTSTYALNLCALLSDTVRCTLKCVNDDGPLLDLYFQLVGDARYIHAINWSNSVAEVVFGFVTFLFVMASLLVQVRVVLASTNSATSVMRMTKWALLFAVAFLALANTGLNFAVMVQNSRIILKAADLVEGNPLQAGFQHLFKAYLIVNIIVMGLFSAVFVGKLFVAMRQRRKWGQRQFGPMQVLFIMGLQTMIIPAIIALLDVSTNLAYMTEWHLTLTALLLPLSTLWAASVPGGSASGSGGNRYQPSFALNGSTNVASSGNRSFASGVKKSSGGEKSRNESFEPLKEEDVSSKV